MPGRQNVKAQQFEEKILQWHATTASDGGNVMITGLLRNDRRTSFDRNRETSRVQLIKNACWDESTIPPYKSTVDEGSPSRRAATVLRRVKGEVVHAQQNGKDSCVSLNSVGGHGHVKAH